MQMIVTYIFQIPEPARFWSGQKKVQPRLLRANAQDLRREAMIAVCSIAINTLDQIKKSTITG